MIQLIQAATLTNNPQLQKNAENRLLAHRTEQTEDFFLQIVNIFQSVAVEVNIRQASGTLLAVSLKTKNVDKFLWDTLSSSAKTTFKDMVLGTMIDTDKQIRRAAANIVAAICCIEIPRKEWPGIAEKITANMSNQDPVVKQVSILTIGFICEQLKEFNFVFDDQMQETILTGILLGVKEPQHDISEIAFKALRDGIPAITSVMKNQTYREYLIAQIAEAFNSKHLVELGLQCLMEFVRVGFGYMTQIYVDGFASLIDPFLRNQKEESTCILSMEFWDVFIKLEKDIESNPQMVRFVKGPIAERLVEGLLQNLCFLEEDQDEGNGISEGAASALMAVFEDDSTDYERAVLAFTQNTIRHENWRYRQGSIRAFATLLIGLPESRSQELVNASLISLVALLNDPKSYVQYSAIRSLCLISEETGTVILHHQNFLDILKLIITKSSINQKFMQNICSIVDNLCLAAENNDKTVLSSLADDLIKVFLDACLEATRSTNSINNCISTILNLIPISGSQAVANKYIDYVLAYFPHISNLDRERRDAFSAGFFTIAQVSLITLRKGGFSLSVDRLSALYDLVVNYFKRINDVEGDGFYVVSALAYFLPNDLRLVEDFWKYIEYGLKKTSQQDVFRSTVSCICDFATTYQGRISSKVDYLFSELLTLFESNMITRELKLEVLMCFGELFLQCGEACRAHTKRIGDILLLSCDGVLKLNDQNYAEVLMETVIETFMCLFHGLNNEMISQELVPYIKYVFEFVAYTTEKSRRPKLDYVKDAMTLLGDIKSFYQNQTLPFSTAPFVIDRINTLQNYNKNGALTQTISYLRQQFRTF